MYVYSIRTGCVSHVHSMMYIYTRKISNLHSIPHLRIIMITSGLAPPKATVKALTVTKKDAPDGSPSKFRVRFVLVVFCKTASCAAEMETVETV